VHASTGDLDEDRSFVFHWRCDRNRASRAKSPLPCCRDATATSDTTSTGLYLTPPCKVTKLIADPVRLRIWKSRQSIMSPGKRRSSLMRPEREQEHIVTVGMGKAKVSTQDSRKTRISIRDRKVSTSHLCPKVLSSRLTKIPVVRFRKR